jgi:Flp pilus assembly pilin Flp
VWLKCISEDNFHGTATPGATALYRSNSSPRLRTRIRPNESFLRLLLRSTPYQIYQISRQTWVRDGNLLEILCILLPAHILLYEVSLLVDAECRKSAKSKKGGERFMELLKRLLTEDDGQGLVEYTLIVVLVALVFWVAIKNTNIGNSLASGWSRVTNCVGNPSGCDSAS